VRYKYFEEGKEDHEHKFDADVYLRYYSACLWMINTSEKIPDIKDLFLPSTRVYGSNNTYTPLYIMTLRWTAMMLGQERDQLPINIQPYGIKPNDDDILFEYKKSPIFQVSGEEL
jgi:hypothetical protein